MVSGFLSPGLKRAAYPDEFASYLDSIDYRLDVNPKLGHAADRSEFVEDAHETIERRYKAFDHYVREDDWDLLFGVFMTTDRVNHFLFRDYDRGERGAYQPTDEDGTPVDSPADFDGGGAFLDFYEQVDDYIGRLRESLADDVTLVIASDHGFTTLDYEVHLNEWLAREGWLSFETDDHEDLNDIGEETRAYSLIPGRFYLNVEGREPRGSVPESAYEERRDELKEMLKSLEGPNGRKVADRVVEKETAYRGAHDDIAPDLTVVPNEGFDLKAGFAGSEDVFGIGPRNGMHTFHDATLVVDDPDVTMTDVNLLDIAPTILDLMEIDTPRTAFDGASLV
jgi:uncharacterized sulfatase